MHCQTIRKNWLPLCRRWLSPANFGGTYTFAGGTAPALTTDNQIVRDSNGQPVLITISSLERFRRTLLFQSLNLSAEQIRLLGGGAAQFSITVGSPAAKWEGIGVSLPMLKCWHKVGLAHLNRAMV